VRVSLLYNANAGDGVPLDRIREAIAHHGHNLVRVIHKNSNLERLLEDFPEIVVAAGGDGTVAAAARMLAHRDIPLGILPLGTANNIAKSVGILSSIDDVIGTWQTGRRVPLDLGVAEGAWGLRYFVEAVGGGLIPSAITEMQGRSDGNQLPARAKLTGAVRAIGDVLSRLQPVEWTIVADGARTTGKLILLEVLNIRSIGPNLVFSADANPSDGFFRVVLAGEEHRDAVAYYLHERLEGRGQSLSLRSQGARNVTLQGATDIHVDDTVLSSSPGEIVSIHIEAGAVELLCPAHQRNG
jgi:diacylglycerol kinase (ATP)